MKAIPVFYCPEYLYESTSIDTTNKAAFVASSLDCDPILNVRVVKPSRAITVDEIELVHSPEYARAIATGVDKNLADKNGIGDWTPGLAESRLWATGGVRDAILESIKTGRNAGSMSSGLHHAHFDYGKGFCTINGLVIGARLALIEGVTRVLILDLDAHGGGGTASLIKGVAGIEQVDVAVSSFDGYQSTSQSKYTLTSGSEYLEVVQRELASVVDPASIGLMIYNAGVDPHEDCDIGGSPGITTEVLKARDEMVFSWAAAHGVPVAFVFAGGYIGNRLSQQELVQLHRNTIAAAAR